MSESDDEFDPPLWAGVLFVGSVAGAVGSGLLGGPALLTNGLVLVVVLTFVYLLYLWGQHRDPPGGDGGGKDKREGELDGKAGGMGYA